MGASQVILSQPSVAAEATIKDIEKYGKAAKALRAAVRRGGDETKIKERVVKETESTLKPLQAAMKSVAAGLDLPEEAKKEAVLQPELLKGHLIELKYWVDKGAFSEYV